MPLSRRSSASLAIGPAWAGGHGWDRGGAHNADLLVTFGFRCNLACTFCLVEDGLDRLHGVPLATFRAWTRRPDLLAGVSRITFSGGEATLEPELPAYVAAARKLAGVRHVRIQTNATRLADPSVLNRLIDAGVDEFFVSVHGWDEASTAAITLRKGAFKAIVRGMEAAAQSSAALLTNTAMCSGNLAHLTDIVRLVAPLRPQSASFWTLQLRVDRPDTRLGMVRHPQAAPHLLAALDACDAAGLPAEVKWFPRCLLGRHASKHDDSQPTTLIEPEFWLAVPRYTCLYRTACAHAAQGCSGLQHAYVERFGWEEAALQPAPLASRPQPAPQTELPVEAVAAWQQTLENSGIAALIRSHGWALGPATRRHHAISQLVWMGDGQQLALEFAAPHAGKAFAHSASFSVSHGAVPPSAQAVFGDFLAELRAHLAERDRGDWALPATVGQTMAAVMGDEGLAARGRP